MIISRENGTVFLYEGFMLAAYLKLPTIAVTLFAVMMVYDDLIIQPEKYAGDGRGLWR